MMHIRVFDQTFLKCQCFLNFEWIVEAELASYENSLFQLQMVKDLTVAENLRENYFILHS